MTAPQLAPGSVVAQKYRVGACLGYAGSAATYQATSAEGRDVVLKIFDPAIRQRADIMSAIEQTYAGTNALPQDVAVPLLDAGYDPGTGAPFGVSERIPFPSLAQLAAQRPLTPEEVSNVLAVLAQLLDRAHQRQLFHHALKPTNIFVGFAQGYGVRVTDFGAGLARSAVPTQEGYALAAPWMAPEQVQASTPPGAAADVFSAALIAFFALTGRSYWRSCQGAMDMGGWQQELLGQRTPPSARAMQLGVMLNSAYDGVLGCALSVDPAQRYRTVGEFAAALEQMASRPPESQSTQAFPAGAMGMPGMGGGGEYPPPPAPMGQQRQAIASTLSLAGGAAPNPYGAQPGAAQGYPGQPQVAAAQPGVPGADQGAGYPGAGPYVSNQEPPAGAGAGLGETAAGRPVDPVAQQRRPPTNRLVPILVGVIALVLLGGGAAAFVILGRKPHDTTVAAATATASADPAASAAPADTGSAAPADTASAAPADTGSAAPAASAEPDAKPPEPESTLACDPECDEITLDEKPIELGKPLVIAAGTHHIVATKKGYVTVKEKITVKEGDKVEKTFKLKEKPTVMAPAPAPAPAGPAKPCGKFLKRCK